MQKEKDLTKNKGANQIVAPPKNIIFAIIKHPQL